jgi:thiol-disulfide isomerase/thioredoxin
MKTSMLAGAFLCANPTQFTHIVSQAAVAASAAEAQLYILFTGAKKADTGLSWCPDCVRAEPLIQQALNRTKTPYVVVTCDVEREPYRSADYVYRKDTNINLR